jgi:hypothetical protein
MWASAPLGTFRNKTGSSFPQRIALFLDDHHWQHNVPSLLCNLKTASTILFTSTFVGERNSRMPLTHRVLKEQRLVVIVGSDVVGADDIAANRQALLSDRDFDRSFDALVDFTRVPDTSLDLGLIRTLSREPLFSRASKIAVVPAVSGSMALFAIARMYETYREVSAMGDRLRVFRTLEQAWVWLGIEGPSSEAVAS